MAAVQHNGVFTGDLNVKVWRPRAVGVTIGNSVQRTEQRR